jgi:hypothetical protein
MSLASCPICWDICCQHTYEEKKLYCEQAAQRLKDNPPPPRVYTTKEPKISAHDIIATNCQGEDQAYVMEISNDWPVVRYLDPLRNDGELMSWPLDSWVLISPAVGEFDDWEQIKKDRGLL